jgi:hypothetical protein
MVVMPASTFPMGKLRPDDPQTWRHPILIGAAEFPTRIVYQGVFLLGEGGGQVLVPADCGDRDATKLQVDIHIGMMLPPPAGATQEPIVWGAASGHVTLQINWRPDLTAVAVDRPFFVGEHWQSKMYLQVACQRVATSTLVHLWLLRSNLDDY